MTGGSYAGAWGYTGRDLGSKAIRMPYLMDTDFYTAREPSVTDTFEVVEETIIAGEIRVHTSTNTHVWLQDLSCEPAAYGQSISVVGSQASVLGCALRGDYTTVEAGSAIFFGCFIGGDYGPLVLNGGFMDFQLCTLDNGGVYAYPQGHVNFTTHCLFDNTVAWDGVVISEGASLEVGGSATVCFVGFTAGVIPVKLGVGATANIAGALWGTDDNAFEYAIKLSSGALLAADAAELDIQGAVTEDMLVGATDVAYGTARPIVDADTDSKVVDRHDYV